VTAIDVSVRVTVSVVLPLTPPRVAEMVVVPARPVVASPAATMVAAVVSEDAQVTCAVRSLLDPSE
jgi:hypothetical protein